MSTEEQVAATPAPDAPGGPNRAWGALAGFASLVAGLGVAEVVAGFIAPSSSPLIALGNTLVDHAPGWLANWAKETLGHADKPVLIGGSVVVAVLLSLLAGILATRPSGPGSLLGIWVVLLLGVAAAAAAATRPDATLLSVLPSVVGAVVGMAALNWLAPHARDAGIAPPGSYAAEVSRRRALTGAGALLLGGAATAGVGRLLGGRLRGASTSRAAVLLPKATDPAPPVPAGAQVDGAVPFITPNRDFYRIDTALLVPQITAESWSLRIHGMVGREVTLTYADLLRLPLLERDITLMCVSNPVGGDLTGNARWLGAAIRPLLEQASPSADADMVLSTSQDGFTCSTPLDVLTDKERDCLFAIGMNGEPLPIEHGFPVRMVVPGLYGYVSATKWVVDLEVSRFDLAQGYWTPRGWSPRGPVKTGSRFDVPKDVSSVKAGTVPLAGIAWAQHRGITRVQVRQVRGADGAAPGEWLDADLGTEDTVDTWRQWVYRWNATPGRYRWQVRAFDSTGQPQTQDTAPPAPDGATGWHTIDVTVS